MIKLIGDKLVLFLLHKLDKYIGTENVLKYLGAWAYARKNKIVKIPMPEAMVIKLKKDLETFGATVLDNGDISRKDNKRVLDSKAFLEANTSSTGVGITNILVWQVSLENKYPGLLDALAKEYPIGEKMSTEKLSTMLDDIADRLEAKGLLKEAYAVDVVSNMIESDKGTI